MIVERRVRGYLDWLSDFIDRSFQLARAEPQLQEHLHFRSSQIILMFIVSEITFVFAIWHEACSVIASHGPVLLLVSILIFILATVQYVISNIVDRRVVTRRGGGGR